MKKIITLLLCAAMAVAVSSCGNDDKADETAESKESTSVTETEMATETKKESESGKAEPDENERVSETVKPSGEMTVETATPDDETKSDEEKTSGNATDKLIVKETIKETVKETDKETVNVTAIVTAKETDKETVKETVNETVNETVKETADFDNSNPDTEEGYSKIYVPKIGI